MGLARMGGCAQTATVLVSTQAWPCCTPSIMASVTVSSVRHLQSADTGKSITIFSINLCGSSTDIQVERSWQELRSFDQEWAALYPGVHNRHKLPGLFSDALTVFKSQTSVDQERQTAVESYLTGLCGVSAVRPFLAEFLGVPRSLLAGSIGSSKPRQSVASAALSVPTDRKGNTKEASDRAQREREKFMAKYANILPSLMPEHDKRLAHMPQTRDDSTGRVGRRMRSIIKPSSSNPTLNKPGSSKTAYTVMRTTSFNPSQLRVPALLEYATTQVLDNWNLFPDRNTQYLELRQGTCIRIVDGEVGDDWWYGLDEQGNHGYFPATFVSLHPLHSSVVAPQTGTPTGASSAVQGIQHIRKRSGSHPRLFASTPPAWASASDNQAAPRPPPKPQKPQKPQKPNSVTSVSSPSSGSKVAGLLAKFQQ